MLNFDKRFANIKVAHDKGMTDESLRSDLSPNDKFILIPLSVNQKLWLDWLKRQARHYSIMGNGINLSGAIIKASRMNIAAISSEKPALPQRMKILAYLVENFFVIKIHVPTMLLNDLSGILKIYLVAIFQISRFW